MFLAWKMGFRKFVIASSSADGCQRTSLGIVNISNQNTHPPNVNRGDTDHQLNKNGISAIGVKRMPSAERVTQL